MLNTHSVNKMRKSSFLDLSGFGLSGKGAFIDLMREFKGYDVPRSSFEFSLIRVKDGIIDLEDALVSNWSPVRSDVAIKRFRRVVFDLGESYGRRQVYKSLTLSGAKLNEMFGGKFIEISERYINSLIDDTYIGPVVYPLQDDNVCNRAHKKIVSKITNDSYLHEVIYIATGDDFIKKTREYLSELFWTRSNVDGVTHVMHNAFEPFYPKKSMNYFPGAKSIVIDRDPRDIYLNALNHKLTNDVPKNIVNFVNRFRMLREKVDGRPDKDILRINFEDLVLNYDNSLNKIYNFLGENESSHINKKKYFNPEISQNGVGIWKGKKYKKEIDYIKENLDSYCIT
jgi:hypothetical protein